jgi:hypothetical protein
VFLHTARSSPKPSLTRTALFQTHRSSELLGAGALALLGVLGFAFAFLSTADPASVAPMGSVLTGNSRDWPGPTWAASGARGRTPLFGK